MSAQFQRFLQLFSDDSHWSSREDTPARNEKGEEEVDALFGLYFVETQRQAIGAALDLLDHLVDAFVLLPKGETFVEVVSEAESQSTF